MHRPYGNGRKYHVCEGIDLYTQEYIAPAGFCAVPGKSPTLEITWCRRGRMECTMADGCILYMGEGDIFLTMTNNHPTTLEFPLGYYSGVAVSVSPTALIPQEISGADISIHELCRKFFTHDDCFLLKSTESTERFFEPVFTSHEAHRESYIKLRTAELLLFLSSLDPASASPMKFYHRGQTDTVKEVSRYIKSELCEKHTVDTLSDRFHISRTSLKSAFREVFGLPIGTYIRLERLQRASDLLLTTNESVAEIASAVGYESSGKFAAAFRQKFGVAPAEYRKIHEKI